MVYCVTKTFRVLMVCKKWKQTCLEPFSFSTTSYVNCNVPCAFCRNVYTKINPNTCSIHQQHQMTNTQFRIEDIYIFFKITAWPFNIQHIKQVTPYYHQMAVFVHFLKIGSRKASQFYSGHIHMCDLYFWYQKTWRILLNMKKKNTAIHVKRLLENQAEYI